MMNREPIFWTTTTPDYNKPDRERVRIENGKRIVEKVPQIGHQGDYENKTRAKGTRYVYIVRHEGHVVPLLLTNAAAHMDANTTFGTYQRRKARAFGWYPAGACPCALRVAGEYTPNHFVSKEAQSGQPCANREADMRNPCKHDIAERAARAERWKEEQAERMAKFKPEEDKHKEEMTALQKQNGQLLATIAELLKESRDRK